MYPFIRLTKDVLLARRQSRITSPDQAHVSHHICWPWDIDMFFEMNNGRILTVYDLGRFAMAQRVGLIQLLIAQGWVLTMAGASVRYRRRITTFERFKMKSAVACWDDRFIYLEQSMWKRNGECASHILYRSGVLNKGKIVPPSDAIGKLGVDPVSPPIPDWIAAWIAAEDQRPWPPMEHLRET